MERSPIILKMLYGLGILCLNFSLVGMVHSMPTPDLLRIESFGNADDTLRDRALQMLTQHMDDLRNLSSRQFAFKSGYTNPNPTVPCEYCATQKDVKLDEYVVDVSDRFENFDFTYTIVNAYDDMVVITNQKGDYEVSVNLKMTVRGLLENDNTINTKKQKTTFLVYKFKLNYIKGIYGIAEITAKQAPGADTWMVEINPNIGVTSPEFGSQDIYDASSSSVFLTKLGVVRYFNPFGGVNPANIWFKAGMRVNLLNSRLSSDFLDFTDPKVRLDGSTEINPHEIDVLFNLTDVVEKQTSVLIEIPVGFSKRFRLSNAMELSLEAEVSYSFALITNYTTTYRMDQLGTNHLFNSDIQSESGGNPVMYDVNPEAVLTSDGERLDFFRNRSAELEPEDENNTGYFTFSFRPTLMIRKFETLKYNIGLNIGFSAVDNDPFPIGFSYFDAPSGASRRPIHNANEATSSIFVGIIFGIKF